MTPDTARARLKLVTRKKIFDEIDRQLGDYQLSDMSAVAETSVDVALTRVLNFTQNLSMELVSKHMYSEAMTTGLIIKKLKELLDGQPYEESREYSSLG